MNEFIVRKADDSTGLWVTANGEDFRGSIYYLDKHGEISIYCTSYDTEAEARAALDLYLEKQKPDYKPTNPKDALGIKKAPLSTLPTGPMYEVALAMLEGARKYGRHNYRAIGVRASVYYDAAMGHLTAWWEGEDIDPVSGIHHLGKAMACLAVVRDSMMVGNWTDDRPPRYPNPGKLMRENPIVGEILKRLPECKEPYTEIGLNDNAAIDHEMGTETKVDRTKPVPGCY